MTFEEWQMRVPTDIREDAVWTCEAYRLGLFLADLAKADVRKLRRMPLAQDLARQLLRAAANISSSVCEGFSRGTGRARATFYEYSLGSAREVRDWYYKVREELGVEVAQHRISLATQLVRLLLTMTTQERRNMRRLDRLAK